MSVAQYGLSSRFWSAAFFIAFLRCLPRISKSAAVSINTFRQIGGDAICDIS